MVQFAISSIFGMNFQVLIFCIEVDIFLVSSDKISFMENIFQPFLHQCKNYGKEIFYPSRACKIFSSGFFYHQCDLWRLLLVSEIYQNFVFLQWNVYTFSIHYCWDMLEKIFECIYNFHFLVSYDLWLQVIHYESLFQNTRFFIVRRIS